MLFLKNTEIEVEGAVDSIDCSDFGQIYCHTMMLQSKFTFQTFALFLLEVSS